MNLTDKATKRLLKYKALKYTEGLTTDKNYRVDVPVSLKEYKRLQQAAMSKVAYRIVLRWLSRPDKFMCVDCKLTKAEVWEHRDYRKPLKVAPVCQACNLARGPALPVVDKSIT